MSVVCVCVCVCCVCAAAKMCPRPVRLRLAQLGPRAAGALQVVKPLYSTVWVVNGYPRAIQWEQTGDLDNGGSGCSAMVKQKYSELITLPWTSGCTDSTEIVTDDPGSQICTGAQFPNTQCGFTTLPPAIGYNGAKYMSGKFDGMGGANAKNAKPGAARSLARKSVMVMWLLLCCPASLCVAGRRSRRGT